MSNNTDSASLLAGRLEKYAYSPSPSPRKRDAVKAEPSTPTRTSASKSSTPISMALRRSARNSTSRSPYFDSGGDGDDLVELKEEPTTPSKTPPKRRADGSLDNFGWKKPRRFAEPEKYAHLPPLNDCLEPNLDLIFCGINPGQRSSRVGHHFAHPTNKFWRALHLSGLTPRLLTPEEDVTLPKEYGYGMTNLVTRPTAEQAELSPHEMRVAVGPLVRKFVELRPGVVCFVGKKIWDIFAGVAGKTGRERERTMAAEARKREKDGKRKKGKAEKDVGVESKVTLYKLEDGVVKFEPEGETKPENRGELGTVESCIKSGPVTGTAELEPPSTPTPIPSPRSFSFDSAQRLRLVLPPCPDSIRRYAYFWVVPSTSGLERTSLSGVAEYLSNLREFLARVKLGEEQDDSNYLDFTLDEVEAVVATM